MELFSAGDEEQWKLIARQIEASDYYVLIAAHRYGSETEEGVSYTEKEYDYAIECGVPTLGFIIDDNASWPASRTEKTQKKIKKLTSFKSKVMSKLVQFWTNKDDLHGKISISLIKTMNTNPRIGWVRSDEAIRADITKELSRLSTENSGLRKEVDKLRKQSEEKIDEVKNVVNIMNENERHFKVRTTKNWSEAKSFQDTLLEIFLKIAPDLIDENSSYEISRNLAFENVGNSHFERWPIGTNRISGIIADFVALDLLEPSKKKHSVNDGNTYWSLSKLGRQVLKRARRIQLEEGIQTMEEMQEEEE
jgi:hypothetical protein